MQVFNVASDAFRAEALDDVRHDVALIAQLRAAARACGEPCRAECRFDLRPQPTRADRLAIANARVAGHALNAEL